jgi:hypothetical protein
MKEFRVDPEDDDSGLRLFYFTMWLANDPQEKLGGLAARKSRMPKLLLLSDFNLGII